MEKESKAEGISVCFWSSSVAFSPRLAEAVPLVPSVHAQLAWAARELGEGGEFKTLSLEEGMYRIQTLNPDLRP